MNLQYETKMAPAKYGEKLCLSVSGVEITFLTPGVERTEKQGGTRRSAGYLKRNWSTCSQYIPFGKAPLYFVADK